MKIFRRATRILTITAMVALTGCFSLSRDEPAIEHYVLSTADEQDIRPQASSPGPTIGLRQVQLSEYLDIPFIVVRRGSNRIVYSDFHRWGEGLAGGINRAVVQRLLKGGHFGDVDGVPWAAGRKHDYLLEVRVERFEGVSPASPAETMGEVHVLIEWQVLEQTGGMTLARGTTEHRERGWRVGEYDALVAALDRGLIRLAEDISSSVERLARASDD
jgi:uncharacterized lipoprotein YmbA